MSESKKTASCTGELTDDMNDKDPFHRKQQMARPGGEDRDNDKTKHRTRHRTGDVLSRRKRRT